MKKSRKIILITALIVVVVLIGGTLGVSKYIFYNVTHYPRVEITDEYLIEGEDISFVSEDGLTIQGTLARTEGANKTVIFSHGYGCNRMRYVTKDYEEMTIKPLVTFFVEEGYNVLMYDFRAHGESEGELISIGYYEHKDLLAAIEYVKEAGLDETIGAIGFSMGAGTTLYTLDKTDDLDFAIADSSFANLRDYMEDNLPYWTGLPAFMNDIVLSNAKSYDVNIDAVSPIKAIENSDIPLLLLHGDGDTVISSDYSVEMSKVRENVELKIFEDVEHILALKYMEDEYIETVKTFIEGY